MPITIYPKFPPYRMGCQECIIAQCNTQYAPEELEVRMPLGWIWTCRESENKLIQNFAECPIVELGYFQRQELFEKYNHTQGEN